MVKKVMDLFEKGDSVNRTITVGSECFTLVNREYVPITRYWSLMDAYSNRHAISVKYGNTGNNGIKQYQRASTTTSQYAQRIAICLALMDVLH